MSIRFLEKGSCVVVNVTGDLDSATCPELEQTLAELISSGHKYIIVNLTSSGFVGSIGMRVLAAAQISLLRFPNADLVMYGLDLQAVNTLLTTTRLGSLLRHFDTEQECFAFFVRK